LLARQHGFVKRIPSFTNITFEKKRKCSTASSISLLDTSDTSIENEFIASTLCSISSNLSDTIGSTLCSISSNSISLLDPTSFCSISPSSSSISVVDTKTSIENIGTFSSSISSSSSSISGTTTLIEKEKIVYRDYKFFTVGERQQIVEQYKKTGNKRGTWKWVKDKFKRQGYSRGALEALIDKKKKMKKRREKTKGETRRSPFW